MIGSSYINFADFAVLLVACVEFLRIFWWLLELACRSVYIFVHSCFGKALFFKHVEQIKLMGCMDIVIKGSLESACIHDCLPLLALRLC